MEAFIWTVELWMFHYPRFLLLLSPVWMQQSVFARRRGVGCIIFRHSAFLHPLRQSTARVEHRMQGIGYTLYLYDNERILSRTHFIHSRL